MGDKISVSWEPLTPEQAWGFVTSYTISYSKEGGGSQKRQASEKSVPGNESSTIIEGLDPNQDYAVSVRADTKAGAGKVSEPASTKGVKFTFFIVVESVESISREGSRRRALKTG